MNSGCHSYIRPELLIMFKIDFKIDVFMDSICICEHEYLTMPPPPSLSL